MPMTPDEVAAFFGKLGLQRPRRMFIVFDGWDEPGLELESEEQEAAREALERLVPRKECTCCECYFHIGPPGCDGTDCHHCGREH